MRKNVMLHKSALHNSSITIAHIILYKYWISICVAINQNNFFSSFLNEISNKSMLRWMFFLVLKIIVNNQLNIVRRIRNCRCNCWWWSVYVVFYCVPSNFIDWHLIAFLLLSHFSSLNWIKFQFATCCHHQRAGFQILENEWFTTFCDDINNIKESWLTLLVILYCCCGFLHSNL